MIDNQYIIVFKDNVKRVDAKVEEILTMSKSNSSSLYSKSLNNDIVAGNLYNSTILGVTMMNVSPDALQILLLDDDVKWIEQVGERMQQDIIVIRVYSRQ